MTKNNNLLGKFELSGIPSAPQIAVTFDVDANGILTVSAEDKSTGKKNNITIINDRGRLSKNEIERMIQEAEQYKNEDEIQRDHVAAMNNLENYCFNVKQTIDEYNKKITGKCEQILQWLETNETAKKEEFEHRQREVEAICDSMITKLYQELVDL